MESYSIYSAHLIKPKHVVCATKVSVFIVFIIWQETEISDFYRVLSALSLISLNISFPNNK